MDADLDTLSSPFICMADDLLLGKPDNARRRVTDAEVVTLCVAQAIMGIPSDPRFLAVAGKQLEHLFPEPPKQPGYHKRRRRLAETIEWLIGVFAAECPGAHDELLLIDSTPVECGRSIETTRRSAARRCRDGYCASHSRYFWGFRLHAVFAPDGTPRRWRWRRPTRRARGRRSRCLAAPRARRRDGLGDKGYAGRDFAAEVAELGATIFRPRRRDEPGRGPHLAPIRQRIESIFRTCKDLLTLERHGARTLAGLRARIARGPLALAACVSLNHWLGRPSRSLVAYVA